MSAQSMETPEPKSESTGAKAKERKKKEKVKEKKEKVKEKKEIEEQRLLTLLGLCSVHAEGKKKKETHKVPSRELPADVRKQRRRQMRKENEKFIHIFLNSGERMKETKEELRSAVIECHKKCRSMLKDVSRRSPTVQAVKDSYLKPGIFDEDFSEAELVYETNLMLVQYEMSVYDPFYCFPPKQDKPLQAIAKVDPASKASCTKFASPTTETVMTSPTNPFIDDKQTRGEDRESEEAFELIPGMSVHDPEYCFESSSRFLPNQDISFQPIAKVAPTSKANCTKRSPPTVATMASPTNSFTDDKQTPGEDRESDQVKTTTPFAMLEMITKLCEKQTRCYSKSKASRTKLPSRTVETMRISPTNPSTDDKKTSREDREFEEASEMIPGMSVPDPKYRFESSSRFLTKQDKTLQPIAKVDPTSKASCTKLAFPPTEAMRTSTNLSIGDKKTPGEDRESEKANFYVTTPYTRKQIIRMLFENIFHTKSIENNLGRDLVILHNKEQKDNVEAVPKEVEKTSYVPHVNLQQIVLRYKFICEMKDLLDLGLRLYKLNYGWQSKGYKKAPINLRSEKAKHSKSNKTKVEESFDEILNFLDMESLSKTEDFKYSAEPEFLSEPDSEVSTLTKSLSKTDSCKDFIEPDSEASTSTKSLSKTDSFKDFIEPNSEGSTLTESLSKTDSSKDFIEPESLSKTDDSKDATEIEISSKTDDSEDSTENKLKWTTKDFEDHAFSDL